MPSGAGSALKPGDECLQHLGKEDDAVRSKVVNGPQAALRVETAGACQPNGSERWTDTSGTDQQPRVQARDVFKQDGQWQQT